jgi:hypothetical protein
MKNVLKVGIGFLALLPFASTAKAQLLISTPNIFSFQTVQMNTSYDYSFFSPALAVDGTTNNSNGGVVFQDYVSSPELLSISGFAATKINTINLFDFNVFGADRTPTSVTIYYSTTDATGPLVTADYTELGVFALANDGNGNYTDGTDAVGHFAGYDTLSGLHIPNGTESVLFSFARNPDGIGSEIAEIQAFDIVEAPEPSAWAMLFGGVGALLVTRRFRSKLSC